MKKILIAVLASTMVFSLAACGGGGTEPSTDETVNPSSQQEQVDAPVTDNDEPDDTADENTTTADTAAPGWEIPAYPYGELVYTKYNDSGDAAILYYNNTTVDECHAYCLTLDDAGYYEVSNHDIHEDSDGLGKYIHYTGMHPSSYNNYTVSYEYSNMEHTVETDSGEVIYQMCIRYGV